MRKVRNGRGVAVWGGTVAEGQLQKEQHGERMWLAAED